MKNLTAILLFCLCALGCSPVEKTERAILDTDMGNDTDDALALLMFYKYEDEGKGKLECIALNKDNPQSAVATDIIAQYYGRGDIPICRVAPSSGVSKNNGWFLKELADAKKPDGSFRFKRNITETTPVPEAVKYLRKVLAQAPDKSISYVSIGFLTNIANLLKSQPDEISPLDGKSLFAKKVKVLSLMGAEFLPIGNPNPKNCNPEFNVSSDIASSKYVFENCPVDIIFSGHEVGASILYPHKMALERFGEGDNPVMLAYDAVAINGRKQNPKNLTLPTYDLTSVLYVFEPELFKLSERGTVSIYNEKGVAQFSKNPGGKHRYMIVDTPEMKKKILDRLGELTDVKPR